MMLFIGLLCCLLNYIKSVKYVVKTEHCKIAEMKCNNDNGDDGDGDDDSDGDGDVVVRPMRQKRGEVLREITTRRRFGMKWS